MPRGAAFRVTLATALGLSPLGTPARPEAAPPSPPPRFSETIEVNDVDLDVYVEDNSGAPVTDLELADFQVLENGKKVALENLARYGPAAPPGQRLGEAAAVGARPESAAAAARREAATSTAPAPPLRLAILIDLDNSRPADRRRIIGDLQRSLAERTPSLNVMVASYSLGGVRVLLPFSASSEEWSLALESTLGGASRMPARELEEQQMMADIGEALKEARQDRSMASSLLQGLLARAQHYATSVNHDSKAVIEALHSFSGALAALPGRKSLLYVGNGFAMRPGEDVFGLLSAVFENDRRFGDSSVIAAGGSNRGAADDAQGEAGRQGQSGAAAVVSFPSRAASSMLQHGTTGLDLTGEVEALSAAANGERVTFYAINSTQTGGLGARAETGRGARIAASPTSNDSPSGLSIFENSRLEALHESLDYVSNTTGGLASAPGANVGAFLDRMWAQSSSYYSLAYPLPHPEETGVRRIKVKVNRKGVRVRHREAYVVKPRTARIGDLMTGALLLHTGENPHRLDAGLAGQEPGADGTYSVSLGLRIPLDELALLPAGDALRTELEVYVLSMDQRGRFSELRFAPLAFTIAAEEARDRPFVATFPLVLEPGSHAVAVGLAERRANRFSVARTTLEIGGAD